MIENSTEYVATHTNYDALAGVGKCRTLSDPAIQ